MTCARRAFATRGSWPPLGPKRYWIHLDVDVLDERVMPATDYLSPGLSGRSWPSCSPRSALRRPQSG